MEQPKEKAQQKVKDEDAMGMAASGGINSASVLSIGTKKYSKLVRRKPYVIALVVLAVLMVAGVGFGVRGV